MKKPPVAGGLEGVGVRARSLVCEESDQALDPGRIRT
jgi:hypothetical protein